MRFETVAKTLLVVGFMFVLVAASQAWAASDVTPIQEAKADLLAYAFALLALGVAVWAALKVVRLFGGAVGISWGSGSGTGPGGRQWSAEELDAFAKKEARGKI